MRAKLNPELSKKIAATAKIKVKEFFTWEIRAKSLLDYLLRFDI